MAMNGPRFASRNLDTLVYKVIKLLYNEVFLSGGGIGRRATGRKLPSGRQRYPERIRSTFAHATRDLGKGFPVR